MPRSPCGRVAGQQEVRIQSAGPYDLFIQQDPWSVLRGADRLFGCPPELLAASHRLWLRAGRRSGRSFPSTELWKNRPSNWGRFFRRTARGIAVRKTGCRRSREGGVGSFRRFPAAGVWPLTGSRGIPVRGLRRSFQGRDGPVWSSGDRSCRPGRGLPRTCGPCGQTIWEWPGSSLPYCGGRDSCASCRGPMRRSSCLHHPPACRIGENATVTFGAVHPCGK